MKNYYYDVVGNYGEDGEVNGSGYATIEEARERAKDLGNIYESYTIYKCNSEDEYDCEPVEEIVHNICYTL